MHWANFIDCVRAGVPKIFIRRLKKPTSPPHWCIWLTPRTASGRSLRFDPAKEQVIDDDEATRMLRGSYRAPYVVPEEV